MGNPVEHSKSPWIHTRFAQLADQTLLYGKWLVPLDGFAESLHDFFAANDGAANTLSLRADGIHADNTDGVGLVRDIELNAGVKLAGRSLLLLGAGGAAAGVLGPLLQTGAAHIVVANRTLAKAEALVQKHSALATHTHTQLGACTLAEVQGSFDVVINATSTSLSGDSLALPANLLKPGALAYDMMYGPAAQGFLDWARALGAQARDGLGMLVEQAAEAFYIWRGVRPPSAQVLKELRAL